MRSYSSRDIIRILEQDGWRLKRIVGDHHQFVHPGKKEEKVTIPHPRKDLRVFDIKSIERQTGVNL